MSIGFDLLPTDHVLDMDPDVTEALIDLGALCNETALLVAESELLTQRALQAEAGGGSPTRRRLLKEWVGTTLSYRDQVVVSYTAITVSYAVSAARAAQLVTQGNRPQLSEETTIVPSEILQSIEDSVPLVQLPALGAGEHHAEHNDELATHHRQLVELAECAARSHSLPMFDNVRRCADRPAGSVEVGAELAEASHRYAASCIWALVILAMTTSVNV